MTLGAQAKAFACAFELGAGNMRPAAQESFVVRNGRAPRFEDPLDLRDVLIAHSLATAIAALKAIQHMLPHGAGGLQAARPFAAPLQLPFELPLPGKAFRTKEAPLATLGIGIGPLNLHDRPS